MNDQEELAEPRSYRELATDAVARRYTGLLAIAFAWNLTAALLTAALLVHVQIVEVPPLASMEQQQGETIASNVYIPGTYASFAAFLTITVYCAREILAAE